MIHILLPIGTDDERAVAQAETVCDLFDSENLTAHLFHDFTDNPEGGSVTQVGSVRRAADVLEDAGIDVEYHEASGDPAETVIETADELDVDAICLAGRKRSPTGKALFGSVSQEVILGTDRPVIICSPNDEA
ncbi:universal stress protein [Halomicrobium salinisoli]|uniref:universal stress protein n=1 Tax=Halomicrobium salinisoli TaxID=2878391 RepID=UPI001CF036C7|nr:universal stress protein [Halomicrobium salinisoli]